MNATENQPVSPPTRQIRVVFIPGVDGVPYSGDRLFELFPPNVEMAQFMFPVTNPGPERTVEATAYPGPVAKTGDGPSVSALSANVSVESMAEAVYDWMASIGWDSAFIVGESYGGAVAQVLANQHPERVQKLVLLSSFTSHPAPYLGWLTSGLLRWWPRWLLKWPLVIIARVTILRGVPKERRDRYFERVFRMPLNDIGRRIKALYRFRRSHFAASDRFPETLWIWGEDEKLVDFRKQLPWIRATLPRDHVVIIEGMGHVISQTQRPVVSTHVRRFFGIEV